MTTEISDYDLLDAWVAGDAEAGNALFERHLGSLQRFFGSKVGSDGDELVQRTMIACVESHRAIRREASFRTYLFTIARHELYRFFRERARDGARLDFELTSLRDLGTSPTGALLKRQEADRLRAAMETLPLDTQVTLELHYVEGLDSFEIADVLGIAPGSVRARLHRARESLERALADLDRGAGA
jgi:RNA polymerase sigma-70 factor (ECF subfamily)